MNYHILLKKGVDQTVWLGRLVCVFIVHMYQSQMCSQQSANNNQLTNITWVMYAFVLNVDIIKELKTFLTATSNIARYLNMYSVKI